MKRKTWFEGGTSLFESSDGEFKEGRLDEWSDFNDGFQQGLCTTCNHLRKCVFQRVPSRPVLFCEEFDCSVEVMTSVEYPTVDERTEEGAAGPAHLEGLCVNCDARATCRFPKAEGGVWYCEEFE